VRKHDRKQERAEHAQARDEGDEREVSGPDRKQERPEHTPPRDEGNKREVSEESRGSRARTL
jgi:hypothetical protein